MPFYDHFCEPCEMKFTVKRPMSEASDLAECPACLGTETQRVYSSPVLFSPDIDSGEVMNRYYSGQETLPGYTREGTMALARLHHTESQRNKNQKAYSGPTISTASHPAAQAKL